MVCVGGDRVDIDVERILADVAVLVHVRSGRRNLLHAQVHEYGFACEDGHDYYGRVVDYIGL